MSFSNFWTTMKPCQKRNRIAVSNMFMSKTTFVWRFKHDVVQGIAKGMLWQSPRHYCRERSTPTARAPKPKALSMDDSHPAVRYPSWFWRPPLERFLDWNKRLEVNFSLWRCPTPCFLPPSNRNPRQGSRQCPFFDYQVLNRRGLLPKRASRGFTQNTSNNQLSRGKKNPLRANNIEEDVIANGDRGFCGWWRWW